MLNPIPYATKRFHSHFIYNKRIKSLSEKIVKLIPKNMELRGLDVGCGVGGIAQEIQMTNRNLTIDGLDLFIPTKRCLSRFILYDGSSWPIKDKSYDFVLLIDVLHHNIDLNAVIKECARVCRKFIIIKDHYRESRWAQFKLQFMDWFVNRADNINLPYNYQTRKQWERIFEDHHLICSEKIENLGLYLKPAHFIFEDNMHFLARLDVPNQMTTNEK